jgi:hypothetical protein
MLILFMHLLFLCFVSYYCISFSSYVAISLDHLNYFLSIDFLATVAVFPIFENIACFVFSLLLFFFFISSLAFLVLSESSRLSA